MHRTTALLLTLGLCGPLASAVYFAGLVWSFPLWAIWVAVIAIACGLAVFVRSAVSLDEAPPLSRVSGLLLLAGVALLAGTCAMRGRRFGDFDAALIWNLHARYLAEPQNWRQMYESGASGNAAYPHGLPGVVALAWRTLGNHAPVVPFAAALLATVGIPVAVYLQAGSRKLLVGAGVLALFGLHRYYLALGLDQYADIQVAWLLLLAAVSLHRGRIKGATGYFFIAGLLLGALCWTKMDGFLLALCLIGSNLTIFTKSRSALGVLLGLLPFAAAWLLLRGIGAPGAPLTNGMNGLSRRLADPARYSLVGSALWDCLVGVHWPFAPLLIGYAFLCWRLRARPSSLYYAVLMALFGYTVVYVALVSTDLEWNLRFSLPRLLLQLYPTLVFVAALLASSALDKRRVTKGFSEQPAAIV